jgi:hypothetical protein
MISRIHGNVNFTASSSTKSAGTSTIPGQLRMSVRLKNEIAMLQNKRELWMFSYGCLKWKQLPVENKWPRFAVNCVCYPQFLSGLNFKCSRANRRPQFQEQKLFDFFKKSRDIPSQFPAPNLHWSSDIKHHIIYSHTKNLTLNCKFSISAFLGSVDGLGPGRERYT